MKKQVRSTGSTGSTRTDAVLTYLSSKTELAEFGTAVAPKDSGPAAMSASAERPANELPKYKHVSPRPDSAKQKRQKILAMSLRNISGAIGMLSSTKHAALNYLQHSLMSYNDPAEAEIREAAATLDAAVRELQAMATAIRANNTVVKLLNDQETEEKKAAARAERELFRQKRKELKDQSKQLKAEYAVEDKQEKKAGVPQFTVKSPLR
jgi:hypothetical protein